MRTPSNTCFLEPIRVHNPNGISIGSAVFAQLMAGSPYTYTVGRLPLRIAPCAWGILTMGYLDPYLCFLGLTRVHNPNGISIGSAVFCRAHDRDRQTDRQTDRPRYAVFNSRPHLRT